MKNIVRLFILIVFLIFIVPLDAVSADKGYLQDYIRDHNSGIISIDLDLTSHVSVNKSGIYGGLALFDDAVVNDDNLPETFKHQNSSMVLLDNDWVLTGWEDNRNGDYDIYSVAVSSDGSVSGDNQRLIWDDNFLSQKMVSMARSASGVLAIVWVNEQGDLFLRYYDQNINALSDRILVNDNFTDNITSYPDLTFLSDGNLVVVWEDTRLGSAIYGQVFNTSYEPVNSNFVIRADDNGKFLWSPEVEAGLNSQFAVCWEEITLTSANVYLYLYDTEWEPIGVPINVADVVSQSDDQYDPAFTNYGNLGYMVGWTDSRDGDQSIYAQLFDNSGNKTNANLKISDGDNNKASDLYLTGFSDGRIFAIWSNTAERSEILGQGFDATQVKDGTNFSVSDPTVLEFRYEPNAVFLSDGSLIASFTDSRTGYQNIYAQVINSDYSLSGSNIKLSDASTGAQQTESDIARMRNDDFGVVWIDERQDASGDIYFQHISQTGTLLGSNIRINDDLTNAYQRSPRIGSADNGKVIVAWTDGRSLDGSGELNIYAQFINPTGLKSGANFRVNDDPVESGNIQSDPDCDISGTGKSVVVWQDNRDGGDDIYCQIYDGFGNPEGGNFKVNTGTDPCSQPSVSIMDNEMFVVAWLVLIDGESFIQFQTYNSQGTSSGSNALIPVDTDLNQQLDYDMAVNPYESNFVLAWLNKTEADSEIHAFLVGFDGVPTSTPKIISDFPNLGFEDIRVEIDALNSYGVVWSDLRDGTRRSYMGFVNEFGIVQSNVLISRNLETAREEQPAIALNGRYVFSSWSDNRNQGKGYDIFANSYVYNATDADDDDNIPLPDEFSISQNYPNPFNPITHIDFSLSSDQPQIEFEVFNILGQSVYSEKMYNLSAGNHSIEFNAESMPSGVYLYRISAGNISRTSKMTLMK